MDQDVRESMILTLSIMTFKSPEYFAGMDDRRLAEEYDRYMKIN